jgi:hypothetical protein
MWCSIKSIQDHLNLNRNYNLVLCTQSISCIDIMPLNDQDQPDLE